MKLEQQVCSLELARRLKELGVKQESLFFYNSETMKLQYNFSAHTDRQGIMHWSISAFTVAELGEMLPVTCFTEKEVIYKNFRPTKKHKYICWQGKNWSTKATADTEADARTSMLIYLLENKLLTEELKG